MIEFRVTLAERANGWTWRIFIGGQERTGSAPDAAQAVADAREEWAERVVESEQFAQQEARYWRVPLVGRITA